MSNEELSNVIDRAEDEYQKLKDKVVEQGLEIERLKEELRRYKSIVYLCEKVKESDKE